MPSFVSLILALGVPRRAGQISLEQTPWDGHSLMSSLLVKFPFSGLKAKCDRWEIQRVVVGKAGADATSRPDCLCQLGLPPAVLRLRWTPQFIALEFMLLLLTCGVCWLVQ